MHEFDLGVWKAVLTHLLRILYAAAGTRINELNLRYREITAFGHNTIWAIKYNVSAMKQLAARDFEDLLQVRTTVTTFGSHLSFYLILVCDACVRGAT